jgi:AcrR family transcriptional regulator
MPSGRPASASLIELRRELLARAREILETRGADQVSTRALGELTGRSSQAVYTAFGARTGLIDALIVAGHSELAQSLIECPTTRSPTTDLLAQVASYLAWCRENPRLYVLMITTDPTPAVRADDRIRLTHGPVLEVLYLTTERLINSGTIRSPDPRYVNTQLAAAVHGSALIELEYIARGQHHTNGAFALELVANLLVALGANRTTTTKSLLRAQDQHG